MIGFELGSSGIGTVNCGTTTARSKYVILVKAFVKVGLGDGLVV